MATSFNMNVPLPVSLWEPTVLSFLYVEVPEPTLGGSMKKGHVGRAEAPADRATGLSHRRHTHTHTQLLKGPSLPSAICDSTWQPDFRAGTFTLGL